MRGKPKYASSDASKGPWTTCDTCGLIWSQSSMAFQFDFQGTSTLQPTGVLRCPKCITPPTYQQKLLVIPPDPPPFFNTRPERYRVDETDWLTTQDGDRLVTQDGDPLINDIPNPADSAMVSLVTFSVRSVAADLSATAFLDFFNGNPAGPSAVSTLAQFTGSATRPNIASQLTFTTALAININPIDVVAAAIANANVTHLAVFTAASGGTRILSGPTASVSPTIQKNFAVRLPSGGFQVILV